MRDFTKQASWFLGGQKQTKLFVNILMTADLQTGFFLYVIIIIIHWHFLRRIQKRVSIHLSEGSVLIILLFQIISGSTRLH